MKSSTTKSVSVRLFVFAVMANLAFAQTTYTWESSNVTGTPAANLDWFTGGSNTQGVWIGGTPVSSNLNTIQFFEDTATALPNTANPSTQNVILNNGGLVFQLGTLTLSGRGSSAANANLTMNLSGDALNFSAATGTINLDAVNNTRTITYNVGNNIQLGTRSTGSALTFTGNGSSAFNITGNITELSAGGGSLIKGGSSTLNLSGTNSYSGGTFINGGILSVASDASLGNSTSGITFTGDGVLLLPGSGNPTVASSRTITVNNGVIGAIGGTNVSATNTITFAGKITGDGGIQVGSYQLGTHITKLSNLNNDFKGSLVLGRSSIYSGWTYGNTFTADVASMVDSGSLGAGNIIFNLGRGISGDFARFQWSNDATTGLVLNNRQIELASTSVSADGAAIGNANTNASRTIVINSDLKVTSTAGPKFLQLDGINTGNNAFNGVIANGTGSAIVSLNKSGTGKWIVSNVANTYTGITNIVAGTLEVTKLADSGVNSSIGASSSAATNLLLGNGATLRYTGSGGSTDRGFTINGTAAGHQATLDASGTDNINFTSTASPSYGTINQTRTLNLRGTNTDVNTLAAFIGDNGTGAVSLVKNDVGTWVLSGTNSYTGTTTVSGGKLVLNYAPNNTTKLADAAALILGGGTLDLSGGSHTEVVASTTLTALTGSYVTRSSGASVLQMGTITNNTGTVNFGAENIATTNNTNNVSTGILGTWATVGGDWAINSTNGANGLITAYTGYTDVTRQSSGTKAIANVSTSNVRIVEGSGGGAADITLGAATTAINTLNQSISGGTAAANISMANQTLRTNGILMGPTAGTLTIGAAGGTAALSGTLTNTTGINSSLIFTNHSASDMIINSVLADNSTGNTYFKTGTGALILAGNNTFNGTFNIQDGIVKAGKDSVSGSTGPFGNSSSSAVINLANKATAGFDINGFNVNVKSLVGGGTMGGNATLTSGKTLTVSAAVAEVYSGIIQGGGNLTLNTSSGWTLNGANTYTGVTTVVANATLQVALLANGGSASGIGASTNDAANLVFNGTGTNAPRLRYNGTVNTETDRRFTLSGNGALDVNSTGSVNWTNTAAITHGVTTAKTLFLIGAGTGTGTLAAQITDSVGATTVSKGLTNNTATGNTWILSNTNNTFNGDIILNTTTNSAGTLAYASAGGANAVTFNQTTGSATLSYIGSTNKEMSGAITASALTTGTITLDSSGTGAVNYSNTASMGSAASGNKNLILAGTSTGNNILAGGWNNNTGGAANITKNGASRWTLSGTNNYTGLTVVNAGTLQFAQMASLYNNTPASWTAANINVKSGATFAVNVDSAATAGFDSTNLNTLLTNISVANTATEGLQVGATLGIDTSTANGGSFTQGNAFANSTGANGGAIGLTKLGTGTLILDKANTYTGATTVSAGKLVVNGSIATSSLTTVASGATLGGSGTVGALTISSGGFVTPGNSPGILTVNGDYIQAGTYTAEIDGLTAGTGHDQISVTGTVNITNGSLSVLFSGSYSANDLIFILLNDGSDAITGTYSGLAQGSTVTTYGGFNWNISYEADSTGSAFTGGNDIALQAVVIPEPKAALLGALGVLLLLRRRR